MSLYDQARDAAISHTFENSTPDTLFGHTDTPRALTQGPPTSPLETAQAVGGVAGGFGQAIARIPAEFSISAGQAGLSLYDLATGSHLTEVSSSGVPAPGMEWLFGDKPLKDYGSQILEMEQQIKNSPFAQQYGLDRHALPLAFAGIVGGESLNFIGGEGEAGAIKALANTTDVGETSRILRQIGVHEDLLPSVAPKIAGMTDPTQIKDALKMVDTLQKTTTLTGKITDHMQAELGINPTDADAYDALKVIHSSLPSAATATDQGALQETRDALAKNLKTATSPAKKAAIQSQIDLIDQKLAARLSPPLPESAPKPALEQPPIGEGIPKDIPEAVQAYRAKFIDEPNKNGTLVEISGDEIKRLNGGDYAPERSKLYSEESYKLIEHEISHGPKKDIVFLGGGPGSIKSEGIARQLKDKGFTGLLYDNSLSNYPGTKRLLDLAKEAGKRVEIRASLPDLEEARLFTMLRAEETGRPVSDADFARGHAGFVDTLRKLLENGDIAPENVHLFDLRGDTVEIPDDVLATLEGARYTEADIVAKYGQEALQAKTKDFAPRPREFPEIRHGAQKENPSLQETPRVSVGEGTQASAAEDAFANYGIKLKKKVVNDKVPLPPTVGELLSNQPTADQFHAIRPTPQETAPRAPQGEGPRKSVQTSVQDTTQKIDLSVKGNTVGEKVRNAIGRSQALKTQIVNKGQEAYLAGRGLSDADLATIRDGYQAGRAIGDIAKATSNPTKATAFMQKMADYYDYELAADRAAGGETPRVQNYLPQYWDLSNPVDKARWDEFAKQRGMQPYYGFRSQSKIFKSYAEGIAAGFTPMRKNILEDLEANYHASSHVISIQALKRGLKEAAPEMVGMSGLGITPEGKSFINSNIPGLEGIAYHPAIDKMLQGFQPLKHADFIDLVKKSGADAALEHVGIMGQVDKMVAMAKSVPTNAEEAGLGGVLGSIYDHVSGPMKQVLWNWSGFHSVNITLSHMGASTLHPVTGIKGVLQSVGSAVSERLYQATVDSYKALMVAKDAAGKEQSVFDWAVESGAFESRGLPAIGVEHFHPFTGGHRLIFDREIPVLQLNLAEQAARKGIVASSPEGIALGKEIRAITGEINAKTMNINPNTLKAASRAFLAPGFTFSKYKTMLDAFASWGAEHGAAGNLARQAVIGKSAIIGVAATLGTLLATGKFPNLQQLLMNFSFNPSVQTNFTNPKGRKIDITFPKTFLAEGAGAILNPVAYGNARLNPLISDMLKLYTNKDYYDRPLVDPNVHTSTALQLAQNLGIGHLPIGAQSVINAMMGKQTKLQAGIQIGGLGTHVSPNDPVMVKYAGIDHAKALIGDIAPNDPDRLEKIQAIFNDLPPDDRKSLAYQELLAGVSTKGIYQSEVERKYFQVQELLKKGDVAGATAITKALSKQDYSTYKSIKTRLAHQATFQHVKDLVAKGDLKGAAALTGAMTKQEYASYKTWKKNNP